MSSSPTDLLTGALVIALLVSAGIAITMHRRYQRIAREEHELLVRILPRCPVRFTYRWDLATGRVMRDLGLVERLGLGAEACVFSCHDWASMIAPAERHRLDDALERVSLGRAREYLVTYTLLAADGRAVHMLDHGVAEGLGPDGSVQQVRGTIGILDEATIPRLHGASALELLATAGESLPPQQALFGPAGAVAIASAGMRTFLLRDGEEGEDVPVGPRAVRAASPADARRVTELWEQAELRGRARRRATLRSDSGEARAVDLSLIRVNITPGRSEMLLQARETNPAHLIEAGRHDATRSELVTHVARRAAHDIASPLGGLRNVAELLRRAGDEPVARERYLTMMERAVDQIQAVNRELARAAEWEQDALAGANLAVVLEDVMHEFAGDGARAETALVVPADARLLAIPDPALRVVARSLLRGAFAASHGAGAVHVIATRVDDDVIMRLEVEPAPVSPDAVPPPSATFLSDARNVRRVTIAAEVLGMFDASLSVHSTPAGGTLFELRCPAAGNGTPAPGSAPGGAETWSVPGRQGRRESAAARA